MRLGRGMIKKDLLNGVKKRLPDLRRWRAALLCSLPYPGVPWRVERRGQTTVEYLMMLVLVASVAVILFLAFYKRILGGIFTVVGLILGAGTPS